MLLNNGIARAIIHIPMQNGGSPYAERGVARMGNPREANPSCVARIAFRVLLLHVQESIDPPYCGCILKRIYDSLGGS
jgi:hypothetical protein